MKHPFEYTVCTVGGTDFASSAFARLIVDAEPRGAEMARTARIHESRESRESERAYALIPIMILIA